MALVLVAIVLALLTVACGDNGSSKSSAVITRTHKFRAGETLYGLASEYLCDGQRWPELVELNEIPLRKSGAVEEIPDGLFIKIPVEACATAPTSTVATAPTSTVTAGIPTTTIYWGKAPTMEVACPPPATHKAFSYRVDFGAKWSWDPDVGFKSMFFSYGDQENRTYTDKEREEGTHTSFVEKVWSGVGVPAATLKSWRRNDGLRHTYKHTFLPASYVFSMTLTDAAGQTATDSCSWEHPGSPPAATSPPVRSGGSGGSGSSSGGSSCSVGMNLEKCEDALGLGLGDRLPTIDCSGRGRSVIWARSWWIIDIRFGIATISKSRSGCS